MGNGGSAVQPGGREGPPGWAACPRVFAGFLPPCVTPGKATGTTQLTPLAGGAGACRRGSQVAGFGAVAVQQLLTCEGSSWPHPSFCWPWSCSPCPALLFPWPLSALLSTSLCPFSRALVLARTCLLAALRPVSLLIMATARALCRRPAPLGMFTHSFTFTSSLWLT